jgi:hypothetical protein
MLEFLLFQALLFGCDIKIMIEVLRVVDGLVCYCFPD